jgi:Protein of unknown function (DUF1761)
MDTSIHHLHHVNHWAILVSALIQWLLGAIWYSPVVFAKPWMRMVTTPTGPNKQKTLLAGMVSSFIGSLILSFVLLHSILWSGASTWAMGAFVGFISWLGFIAAPSFAQGIYESRPFKLFAINTGYWLVGLLITGGLLAVWR